MNLYAVGKTLVKTALSPLYRFQVSGTEKFENGRGASLQQPHSRTRSASGRHDGAKNCTFHGKRGIVQSPGTRFDPAES